MIDTLTQKVQVADVVQVIVTTTEQQEDGTYVRELRFMTKAEGETQASLTFTLRLVGQTDEGLHVVAPSSEF